MLENDLLLSSLFPSFCSYSWWKVWKEPEKLGYLGNADMIEMWLYAIKFLSLILEVIGFQLKKNAYTCLLISTPSQTLVTGDLKDSYDQQ